MLPDYGICFVVISLLAALPAVAAASIEGRALGYFFRRKSTSTRITWLVPAT